jgi:cytochrome c-type biogenesis protein CcmH/NrfG
VGSKITLPQSPIVADFRLNLTLGEAHFVTGEYDAALTAYATASSLAPLETAPLAGLAVIYHALGQVTQARRMWKMLIARDSRYLDPRWLRTEQHWPQALLAEAKKVIDLI